MESQKEIKLSFGLIKDRSKHPALKVDPNLKPPYPGMIISLSPKSEEVLPPITIRYKK